MPGRNASAWAASSDDEKRSAGPVSPPGSQPPGGRPPGGHRRERSMLEDEPIGCTVVLAVLMVWLFFLCAALHWLMGVIADMLR